MRMVSGALGFVIWTVLTASVKFGDGIVWLSRQSYRGGPINEAVATLEVLAETARREGIEEFWEALKDYGYPIQELK